MDDHAPAAAARPENVWLNLVCNIVLPGLILSKLSGEDRLGPVAALLVGLTFPFGYGIYDLVRRRKWNLFSIVGVISVAVTGGLGLYRAGALAFAVKEAAVPAMFAVAVLATLRTRRPLVREMMLNEAVLDVAKLEAALRERGTEREFDRLLLEATRWLAAGFVVSAVLNFTLARLLLHSPAGTPEFTAELGRMTWLSWPVIVAPFFAIMILIMWRLFRGVQRLTGYELEALMRRRPEKS